MKTKHFFRLAILSAALPATLILGTLTSNAQPPAGAKAPRRGAALKHAEELLGKPLTPAQKSAIKAAQKERAEAMKPIQDKFKAKVAKALGMTVAQLEAKEKSLRQKKAK